MLSDRAMHLGCSDVWSVPGGLRWADRPPPTLLHACRASDIIYIKSDIALKMSRARLKARVGKLHLA